MAVMGVILNNSAKVSPPRKVDAVSETFIKFEFIFGLNRLPIIGNFNLLQKGLIYTYVLLLNGLCLSLMIFNVYKDNFVVDVVSLVLEYNACALFAVSNNNRLKLFYDQIHCFDQLISHEPIYPAWSKYCFFVFIVQNIAEKFTILLAIGPMMYGVDMLKYFLIPLGILNRAEHFFLGHLLTLITVRLTTLKKQVKSATNYNLANEKVLLRKCVVLYDILITAFDYLNEVTKWSIATMINFGLFRTLCIMYKLRTYDEKLSAPMSLLFYVTGFIVNFVPLLWISVNAELVTREVYHLRSVLTSKMYERNMSEESRAAAQILLSLTRVRDLSFHLMGMCKIDVKFPIKYLGVLITYLVILLQFRRVINLSRL